MRYFEDDDGMDLREMVRREKMSSAEDQNALYSRMAAKVSHRLFTHQTLRNDCVEFSQSAENGNK